MAGAKAQAKKKPPAKPGKAPARATKAAKTAAKAAVKPKSPAKLKVVRGAAPSKSTAAKTRSPAPALTVVKPAPAQLPKSAMVVDHLHQVALVATDLDAAVRFYGEVIGLRFIARFDPPGLAFFDLGNGLRLMLSATASSATLYFHVKNLDTAVTALTKRGASFLHKPSLIHRDEAGQFGKRGGEEWMAFFRDPSGNVLALVSRK